MRLKLIRDMAFTGALFVLCALALVVNYLGLIAFIPGEQTVLYLVLLGVMAYAVIKLLSALWKFFQL